MNAKILGWKIDKDLISGPVIPGTIAQTNEAGTWGDLEGVRRHINGKGRPCTIPDSEFTVPFRIKDGDEEIYYEGRMTHALADSCEILRPLDDFATPNAGATDLEIWSNVAKNWEPV